MVKPPAAEFDVVKHAQDKIKKLKEELKEHEMNKIQVIADDVLHVPLVLYFCHLSSAIPCLFLHNFADVNISEH